MKEKPETMNTMTKVQFEAIKARAEVLEGIDDADVFIASLDIQDLISEVESLESELPIA